MCDIWSCITDVTVHLAHDTDVLVTVQQAVLVIFHAIAPVGSFVCLQAGVRQDYDETLAVFVGGWDGMCLLGDELW